MMAIISIMEAVACVRKYFVAASVARGLKFFINTGIIANRFISNPIQMSSQCELIIIEVRHFIVHPGGVAPALR